jgi:hypothetical protein
MKLSVGCAVLAAVGAAGCGTGTSSSEEARPDALTCAQTSWSVVHSFGEHLDVPSNVVLHDGVAFLGVGGVGIVALPTTGGDPVVLTTETATKVWLEGDSIYFGRDDDKLRRLPVAGGAPTFQRSAVEDRARIATGMTRSRAGRRANRHAEGEGTLVTSWRRQCRTRRRARTVQKGPSDRRVTTCAPRVASRRLDRIGRRPRMEGQDSFGLWQS